MTQNTLKSVSLQIQQKSVTSIEHFRDTCDMVSIEYGRDMVNNTAHWVLIQVLAELMKRPSYV